MKNILKTAFILLLCMALCAGTFACAPQETPVTPPAPEEPEEPSGGEEEKEEYVFTFGVFADTQVPGDEQILLKTSSLYNAKKNLKAALNFFKEKGTETVLAVGDIVDYVQNNGKIATAYEAMREVMDEVWGESDLYKPQNFMFTTGNHEFYYNFNDAEALLQWSLHTGAHPNTTFEVEGYTFLAIDFKDVSSNISADTKRLTEERLAAAAAKNPDQPIFIATHIPPSGSVYKSEWKQPDDAWLREVLAKYPQAVVFTGHTHFSAFHPLSIDQNYCTVVNIGPGTYVCTPQQNPAGKPYDNVDSQYLPLAGDKSDAAVSYAENFNDMCNALLVDVYTRHIEIRRYDCLSGEQIGAVWSVKNASSAQDFTLVRSAREAETPVPQFAEDHGCTARWNPSQPRRLQLSLKAPALTGDNVIDSYRVEISHGGETVTDKLYQSDYWYTGVGNGEFNVLMPVEYIGMEMTVRITPTDGFGRSGDPLVLSVPAV